MKTLDARIKKITEAHHWEKTAWVLESDELEKEIKELITETLADVIGKNETSIPISIRHQLWRSIESKKSWLEGRNSLLSEQRARALKRGIKV